MNKNIYLLLISLCILGLFSSLQAENITDINTPISGSYYIHSLKSNAELYAEATTADSIGDKNTAIALYTLLIARSDDNISCSEKEICAKAANAAGILYFKIYNFSKALKMFVTAGNICDQIGDTNFKIQIGNNIGVLYSTFQDYTTAISYFESFYDNKYQQAEYKGAGYALLNIISSAIVARDTVAALKYLNYTLKSKLSDLQVVNYARTSGNAFVYAERKDFKPSLVFAKEGLTIALSYDFEDILKYKMLCYSHHYIGVAYTGLKQYDSARHHLSLSNEIAKKHSFKDVICVNYLSFANIFKDEGKYKDYGKYMELYVHASNSLYNIKEYSSLKDIVYGARLEQTENEIYRLMGEQQINNRMIKQQRTILFGSFLTIALTSLLVLLLYKQKRKLSESYLSLFQKNKEIMRAEAERQHEREVGKDIKYSSSSLSEEGKKALLFNIQNALKDDDIFSDPDFTLESFASMLESNTKYVSQVINEYFNKNFTTFVNEHRIKSACKLFENSFYYQYTIEAIGQKVGFKSRNNFNAAFKKYIGIPPSQYLKMCNENKIS